MKHWKAIGLEEFLSAYSNIRLVDVHADKVELQGEYQLKAQLAGSQFIERTFSLRIVCPRDYPRALPVVYDTAGYFPRNQDFHTYSDGSFCLGSDLKIKSILRADSSLITFFEKIVVRFLYSVSHRVEFGNFPYGELEHGEKGLIDDYSQLLNVNGKTSVLRALKALALRKRVANKLPCPCGCGGRLGSCKYRFILNEFRQVERRRWFRDHLQQAFTPIEKPKKRVGKPPKKPGRNIP
ncbi:ubiquitin-conjugating enzyme family protein [Shewanella xiamenensis]|uniref:hypothetical protein n=1 Tax=Shewanella xiamenensis TaxID=332186 RepID=UPI000849A3E6|nr:hypothetical protein [Shewanella xiamenensis]MEE1981394.1 hypothetical protein [Shewanella xiamenensis]ODR86416.1 hypothetical protein ABT47_14455 [Shewanella xiamenensis]PHY62801.1 hypothetical protein CS023_13115 [Shewanella xiamenensis]